MRPIGYWLKHLDGLIEAMFVAALGDLTRRHWQVLNVLASGTLDREGVAGALGPFSAEGVVGDLERRGLVDGGALTEAGRVEHARLVVEVGAVRELVMEGVGAEEYSVVVGVLGRMAGNLERGLGLETEAVGRV